MPEDRDQLFEKALARHLRAESAGESLCPDPETLAAYHERMLSPEELASAKSHIVSCARCQKILAQLEATQELNGLQEAAELVPAADTIMAASAPSQARREPAPQSPRDRSASPAKVAPIPQRRYSSLRYVAPAGAIAAALLIWIGARQSGMKTMAPASSVQVAENRQQAPASPARDDAKEYSPPKEAEKQKAESRSADHLNEMAPRSPAVSVPQPSLLDEEKDSAAAGKLEQRDKKLSPNFGYSAQNRSSLGGPSAAAAQAQANNALQRGDQAVVGGAPQIVEPVPTAPDLDKAAPQKNQPAPARKSAGAAGLAKAAPAPPPPATLPPAPKSLPARLRGTVTDPSGAAVPGASVELKSANGARIAATSTDTSGSYSFADVAAGNYELQLQSPGFKTDSLTGLNVAPGDNVMNARLEIGAASETVEVTAAAPVLNTQAAEMTTTRARKGRDLQALLLASSSLQTVASPGGNSLWKFGETGQIFHSKNAGKEWTPQASGVSVRLLAASAPSAKVCWIAGAAGTLLLTTDGGKHWQRITVPLTADLGGVHASDARHASIRDASNRKSYETSDGGKTWKQSANE